MPVPDAANSRASRGTGTEAAVRDRWPEQSSAVTDNEDRSIVTIGQAATMESYILAYSASI